MSIFTVSKAAEIVGINRRTIYRYINEGIIPKYDIPLNNKILTGVNIKDVFANFQTDDIISVYEVANRSGIKYSSLMKEIKEKNIPTIVIQSRSNGMNVIAINIRDYFLNNVQDTATININDFIPTKVEETKPNKNVLVDFNLEEAMEGVVSIVTSTGEKVIEIKELDSDVKNKVVYVKQNGFIEVCDESGKFGDKQVLFIKGKKSWANVLRDEWNELFVDSERYDTAESAVAHAKKIERSDRVKLITTINIEEPDYL